MIAGAAAVEGEEAGVVHDVDGHRCPAAAAFRTGDRIGTFHRSGRRCSRFPCDTLSSPLGTFTTHLQRLVERVRHQCKIRSPEGRQAALDQVRDSSMHRRTAFTTSPGVIGLCSTQAGFRWRRGSRLSVRMMTGRCPLRDRGNLLTNRGAIDVREHEVEDDRIEGVAIEDRQRLDAVSCFQESYPCSVNAIANSRRRLSSTSTRRMVLRAQAPSRLLRADASADAGGRLGAGLDSSHQPWTAA